MSHVLPHFVSYIFNVESEEHTLLLFKEKKIVYECFLFVLFCCTKLMAAKRASRCFISSEVIWPRNNGRHENVTVAFVADRFLEYWVITWFFTANQMYYIYIRRGLKSHIIVLVKWQIVINLPWLQKGHVLKWRRHWYSDPILFWRLDSLTTFF